MKKSILAVFSMTLFAALSNAAPVTVCTGGGTSSGNLTIGALASDGYICGDKLFTGFTGNATGVITLTEINPDLYRLSVIPGSGSASAAFTFGFTVSVIPGGNQGITQIQDQMLTAQQGGGGQIPNNSTATVTHSGGAAVNLNALSFGGQTGGTNLPYLTSTTVNFSWTPGVSGGGTVAGLLTSAEFQIIQGSIPEPGSMALMGSGLLGLGLAARRRLKK